MLTGKDSFSHPNLCYTQNPTLSGQGGLRVALPLSVAFVASQFALLTLSHERGNLAPASAGLKE